MFCCALFRFLFQKESRLNDWCCSVVSAFFKFKCDHLSRANYYSLDDILLITLCLENRRCSLTEIGIMDFCSSGLSFCQPLRISRRFYVTIFGNIQQSKVTYTFYMDPISTHFYIRVVGRPKPTRTTVITTSKPLLFRIQFLGLGID